MTDKSKGSQSPGQGAATELSIFKKEVTPNYIKALSGRSPGQSSPDDHETISREILNHLSPKGRAIYSYLEKNGNKSKYDISEATGIDIHTVEQVLTSFRAFAIVEFSCVFHYWLKYEKGELGDG